MNPRVTPERIDAVYNKLGCQAGWRFMTSPLASFIAPKVLLVSLNPSGTVEHGPRWSQEAGSAYAVESWAGQMPGRDPLQVQIRGLMQHLSVSSADVASAHFVPFRSQRWADLPRKQEAVAFARELWRDFVEDLAPSFVICLGTTVGEFIPKLFGTQSLVKRPTGWGTISMSVGRMKSGGKISVLPHLGTFKLFSRPECASHLKAALGSESLENAQAHR